MGLLHHKRTGTAAVAISEAKRALGIGVSLTGALGRKTKFQEKATSLLLLKVTRLACAPERTRAAAEEEAAEEARAAREEAAEAAIPGHVIEEDDTLLTTPKLEEGAEATAPSSGGQEISCSALRPLEQQVSEASTAFRVCISHACISLTPPSLSDATCHPLPLPGGAGGGGLHRGFPPDARLHR